MVNFEQKKVQDLFGSNFMQRVVALSKHKGDWSNDMSEIGSEIKIP